jgi:cell division protein FtsW (lipid II flippase)
MPHRDPYLLPLAGLLSGWGVLAVWRLDSGLGLRQALWVVVGLAALLFILNNAKTLSFLRRHRYVLLATGLLLTALTLVLGSNPPGVGPRLWLGCCGLYLQPSEPLKLLLVAYLAAYLADRAPIHVRIFPLLPPTILLTSLALLILIVQQDLGTTSIFILLYTAMLYLATEKRRVLVLAAGALVFATLTGYSFIRCGPRPP